MAQTKIVLVDFDSRYLAALERVFVREYRFTAEIVLLPSADALKRFFTEPKTIDILLISEKQYDQSFARHNIGHLFILTEQEPSYDTAGELFPNMLHKYINGKTIIESVISRTGISHATNLHSDVSRVLMVFSPVGGAGQTTLAVGVCTLIARNFRRVLFVGADGLQTFGYIMKSRQRLHDGVEKTVRQKSKYAYERVKPMIASERFDILPPFPTSLAALGVTQDHMLALVDQIKHSGDYDFIVIDGGSDFTEATTGMMAYADQVLLVAAQDENSLYKLHCLLDSIDCSDPARFALVCNKCRRNGMGTLAAQGERAYPHTEFIEFDPKVTPKDGEYLASLPSMQKLGQLFL